jgi:hypothetical protein
MNLRYFQKTPNNNLIINNPYSIEEISKSEDKNYFNSLTKEQLSSLKLYKFNPIKTNKENEIEEENIDKSAFIPTKELLKIDFEKMVKNNDNDSIKKYLPQMMFEKYNTKDLPNPKNAKLKTLLIKYQESLRYLLGLEKKMNKFNSLLDQHAKKVINEELNNYGKEKEVNKQLEENDKKINKLFKKIDKYKNIINFANKNKKRSLASFVLIIKDNDNNFYCDLCPNEIFESYKEVQIHSLSRHEHILKLRKKNYEINNNLTSSYNIEQKYLDTKMKDIQEEFDTFIQTMNINKENENNFKNKNDNYLENDENFDIDINKQINDNDLIILEKKINILEENQSKNQEMLLKNLDDFKKEIFTQIKNLQNNQSLFFEEEKNNKNIKNEIGKNLNDIKIENDKNLINNNISSTNNKNNITNKNDITDNNIFQLGEKYQENTSILESYNYNFNKDENDISNNNINQMKNKNNIFIPPKENYLNTNKEPNLNNKDKNKINIEKVNQPNFEMNPNNKLEQDLNNFAKKYYEREKNILFTQKINQPDFDENYKILNENKISENTEIKKENEFIEKLNDKYNLNKEDLTKSGYNNVINEIINKNQNVQNENYKAYFNNIISFLELNKDLNNSIIK